MTSLCFVFIDSGRVRVEILGSASWDNRRDHVVLQFRLEPDLEDEAASMRLQIELRKHGFMGLDRDVNGWSVNGEVIKAMLSGQHLPAWFQGEVAAKFASRQKTDKFRGSVQRCTEVSLTVQEPDTCVPQVNRIQVESKELSPMVVTIQSSQQFKSIAPIETPIALQNLSVLTGKNGAGKTHLLSGIAAGQISLSIDGKTINPQQCRYISELQLSPKQVNSRADAISRQQLSELWQQYEMLRQRHAAGQDIQPTSVLPPLQFDLVKSVAKTLDKDFYALTVQDFNVTWPVIDLGSTDVLAENLAAVCRRYDAQKQANELARWKAETKGSDAAFLSDAKFAAHYGPAPWVLVNESFERAGLDVRLAFDGDVPADVTYSLRFTTGQSGVVIEPNDLSSGEKTLLSLFAATYNAECSLAFPQVLLLDEPDCHLHPSMTRRLLTILESILVKERGITVLMTTHSPSTVALSPEEALFVLQASTPKVKSVSKDEAIGVLLEGVPTVSLNHENRRQVFVEAPTDSEVLGRLYTHVRSLIRSDVSLSFIEAGSGGDTQVRKQVSMLRDGGVRSVFGIIDSDGGKNRDEEFVVVLGGGSRYTLENYLLDPLLIAACFVKKPLPEPAKVGLPKGTGIRQLAEMSPGLLQAAVDTIVAKVGEVHKDKGKSQRIKVTYSHGLQLEVPDWYLSTKGKELEQSVCAAFPELSVFHRNIRSALIRAIAEHVAGEFPEFIPAELVVMMRRLQSHGLSAEDADNDAKRPPPD